MVKKAVKVLEGEAMYNDADLDKYLMGVSKANILQKEQDP